jgi:hypothetical protein
MKSHLKSSTRYFYITYVCKDELNYGYGSVCLAQKTYPCRNKIRQEIKENLGKENAIIINIVEMTEQDYNQFLKQEQ